MIIIWSAMWIISYCLGLCHKKMLCSACLAIFLHTEVIILSAPQHPTLYMCVCPFWSHYTTCNSALALMRVCATCWSHYTLITSQWRHNEHDGVSNHQLHDCLLRHLFTRRSKKTSKVRVTGLCEGNSPVTVNSPHKGPVATENVSIWWHHHESIVLHCISFHHLL